MGIEFLAIVNVVVRIVFYIMSFVMPIILLASPFRIENPVLLRYFSMLPFVIFSVIIGPTYLLADGIFDPHFQYVLTLDNISIFIGLSATIPICVLVRLMLNEMTISVSSFSVLTCSQRSLRASGWLFLGLALVCFLLLSSQTFGVIEWILDPRQGYQFHRSTRGFLFAGLVNFLSFATVLLGISERPLSLWFIVVPLGAFLSYLCGSKGVIQNYGVWLITLIFIRGIQLRWYIFVIIGVFTSTLMLGNFYLSDGRISFSQIAGYFDYYANSASIMKLFDDGKINFFQGDIFASSFWQYVPRALIGSKPYDYGTLRLNEILWPGLAAQGHTPSFGGPIELYSDFGELGVIFGSFVNSSTLFYPFIMGLGLKAFKEGFFKDRHKILEILAFIVLAAPSFMTSLGGFLASLLVLATFVIISAFDVFFRYRPVFIDDHRSRIEPTTTYKECS